MSYSRMDIGTVVCELVQWHDVSLTHCWTLSWHSPFKNSCRVSECDATHCKRANALQTRFETWAVRLGGESSGYTDTISCSNAGIIPGKPYVRESYYTSLDNCSPNACHKTSARSSYCSLFLLNSSNAPSLLFGSIRSMTRP
jgi:hypothetical protein